MRAMVLEKTAPVVSAPLRSIEMADPEAHPGELVLRVSACAVCRTDLQLCEGDVVPRRLPVVPGHQIVGTVERVGEGVGAWRAGDRAGVAWLGGACGVCASCTAGRENLCEQARFTGWDRNGGFASLVSVRADYALALPERFSDLEAAPLLCGGIIGYRALKRSGVRPGQRLGLFGFGASASLAIQIARHWGCEVFVATRSAREQERARALGASWTGDYDKQMPAPLDAAVTFAPAGAVVVAALRSLGRGGTVAINAIHLDRVPEFPYEALWWERGLVSVANFTRDDAREFLQLAAAIPVRTSAEAYPLADANRALLRLSRGEGSGTAVLDLRS